MKMKIQNQLMIAALGVICSLDAALAGPISSGGGGSFVCRQNGDITSAELIDLWEARAVFGRAVNSSNDPVDYQVAMAINKLERFHPRLADKVTAKINALKAVMRTVPTDMHLPPPPDSELGLVKPNCPAEGLAFYDGRLNALFYNPEIYTALSDNSHRAALLVHEGLYAVMREMPTPVRNSVSARQIVGCLFSAGNDCFGSHAAEIPPGARVENCYVIGPESEATEFLRWPVVGEESQQEPAYALSITRFMGRFFTMPLLVDKIDIKGVPIGSIKAGLGPDIEANMYISLQRHGRTGQLMVSAMKDFDGKGGSFREWGSPRALYCEPRE